MSADVYCLDKPGLSKLRCKKPACESHLNSMSTAVAVEAQLSDEGWLTVLQLGAPVDVWGTPGFP